MGNKSCWQRPPFCFGALFLVISAAFIQLVFALLVSGGNVFIYCEDLPQNADCIDQVVSSKCAQEEIRVGVLDLKLCFIERDDTSTPLENCTTFSQNGGSRPTPAFPMSDIISPELTKDHPMFTKIYDEMEAWFALLLTSALIVAPGVFLILYWSFLATCGHCCSEKHFIPPVGSIKLVLSSWLVPLLLTPIGIHYIFKSDGSLADLDLYFFYPPAPGDDQVRQRPCYMDRTIAPALAISGYVMLCLAVVQAFYLYTRFQNQQVTTSQISFDGRSVDCICPSCGHANLQGANFCSSCGNSIITACPSCNESNLPESNFCNTCGISLTLVPARGSLLVGIPIGAVPHTAGAVRSADYATAGGEQHVSLTTSNTYAVQGEDYAPDGGSFCGENQPGKSV